MPGSVPATNTSPEVLSVAVGPDGTFLAAASDDGLIRIWDLATGSRRAVLSGAGGAVRAVAASPDGSFLVTAESDNTVRIWDPATGQERARLFGADPVEAVAVSPDGSFLVTGGRGGTVQLWDPATVQERTRLTGADPVEAVAISPDGSFLVTGGRGGTVQLWDARTGRGGARLIGTGASVEAVAISPDGSFVVTGGSDGMVSIWDLTKNRTTAADVRLFGLGGPVWAVAVSPDGSFLVTGESDNTVRIRDPATGGERAKLTGAGPVEAVAISPDGSFLVTGGSDSAVRLWDPATGSQIGLYWSKPTAFVSYAQEDRSIVERLREALTDAGFAVWSDDQIPIGASIAGQIERAIRSSDVVFVVSSPSSSGSPAVTAELVLAVTERGRDPRKAVIPVLAGDESQVSPLLRDIAGLNVRSDDQLRDQLAHLARHVLDQNTGPGSWTLQRTSQDLQAQFALLEAERLAIDQKRVTDARVLKRRERQHLRTLLLLILSMSFSLLVGLSVGLVFSKQGVYAGLVVGLILSLVLGFYFIFVPRLRDSQSAFPDWGGDDDA